MPVRRLGFISTMLSRSISAGQRILEILEQDSPVKEKAGAIDLKEIQGEVRFEGVSFNYDSTGNILKDVSFTVYPGQTVALVGGSGSGKSTIVSLIPRFYDPQKGRITIDGIDIREVKLNSLRKMVGIVQQDIFLFSTTIKENIAYGSENASMEDIIAAAKIAELHDFIQSLPDKYDTVVGERGVTLSGGERQRIAIARTILHNPRILIFDDSTSSVDAETELSIRRALKAITRNRTTFIITHRLPVIKNADIILVLQDGYLVEQGNHHELMRKNGIYRRLFESQLPPDLFFDSNSGEG
jgi:ATP-binding cassette subfamily B protein